MRVLFVLLSCPSKDESLYTDLATEFVKHGHEVSIVAPCDSDDQMSGVYDERGFSVLRVRSIQTKGLKSIFKKAVSAAILPFQYKKTYKKYWNNEEFDVVVLPTPPITFIDFVEYVLKRNKSAKFYLLLRDIHPHCVMRKGMNVNPIMIQYLMSKAQKGYKLADYIGCMSPGNMSFVRSIAKELKPDSLCLLPNWVKEEPCEDSVAKELRVSLGLEGKVVVLYGGTISSAQGLDNFIALAKHSKNNEHVAILIVGKGAAFEKLRDIAKSQGLNNVIFKDFLPRREYQSLMDLADIGLVSLDKNYIVPTCPSKIISYMTNRKPVFAMINKDNDYGTFYVDNAKCGYWTDDVTEENGFEGFDKMAQDEKLRIEFGDNGYEYYKSHFTPAVAYQLMAEQIKF